LSADPGICYVQTLGSLHETGVQPVHFLRSLSSRMFQKVSRWLKYSSSISYCHLATHTPGLFKTALLAVMIAHAHTLDESLATLNEDMTMLGEDGLEYDVESDSNDGNVVSGNGNCPAGKAKQPNGPCQICAAGKYGEGGAYGQVQGQQMAQQLCKECVAGKITASNEQSVCTDCVVGKYANVQSATVCTECPAGKYSDTAGTKTLCPGCAAGKFSSTNATTVCQDCALGHFALNSKSVCSACTAGKHQNATAASTCHQCQAGQHQNATAQTACTSAPANTHVPTVGQSHTTPCECDTGNSIGTGNISKCHFAAGSAHTCTACAPLDQEYEGNRNVARAHADTEAGKCRFGCGEFKCDNKCVNYLRQIPKYETAPTSDDQACPPPPSAMSPTGAPTATPTNSTPPTAAPTAAQAARRI